MKMPWTALIDSVSSLASEFIEDKDKLNEINLKIRELESKVTTTLLSTKTTPKADAFVKILIAFRDIVVPLLRPVGASCMTAVGLYCHLNGVEIDGATHAMIDGAFPAWGASRHVNKHKEEEEKTKRYKKEEEPLWLD